MRCPHCDRSMTLLFVSAICDWCDGPPRGTFYRGFVVWQDPPPGEALSEYVFRTLHDAVVWRSIAGHEDREIVPVLSVDPIPWRVAAGKASGLVCADRLFDIFKTHRFPKGPYRAFVAPSDFRNARDCAQISL